MDMLQQLAQLLTQTPTPQTQVATNNLYNQIAATGQVPLDNEIMLKANPQMVQALRSPEEQLLAQLERSLTGAGGDTQAIYNQLASGGQVPLDNPIMLMANPQLAQTLQQGMPQAQAPAPAPTHNFLPGVAPDTKARIVESLTPSFTPESLGKAPTFFVKNALNTMSSLDEFGQRPEIRDTLGAFIASAADGFNEVGSHPMVRDTLGRAMYALFGDSSAPVAQPAQPAAQPMQAPQPVQQTAPVQAQQAQRPVQAQAPTQQMPVASPQDIASLLMQAPVASTGNVATPDDIVNALTSQPQQPLAGRAEGAWYSRPEFLTYIGDVLNNTAMNPNWAQGIAQGNMQYEQRGVNAQKMAQEQMLMQANLAKLMSETDKNRIDAKATGMKAMAENDPNSLANAKTNAEIARIKAETALANVRAKYAGQEQQFNDKDYVRAFPELLTAYQGLMELDPENPKYLFGPEFAAREELNSISPNVTREMAMTGNTQKVLTDSRKALAAGEITEEEYASRLLRAQKVHGTEAIRQFIGASQ